MMNERQRDFNSSLITHHSSLPNSPPRMKERLSGKLSLASKLRLKRVVFAPVVWAVRLAGRAYDFAVRLAGSAETR